MVCFVSNCYVPRGLVGTSGWLAPCFLGFLSHSDYKNGAYCAHCEKWQRRVEAVCHRRGPWQRQLCDGVQGISWGERVEYVENVEAYVEQDTRQQVAIKTVKRDSLTAKLFDNLQSEIQILKSLSHRHITRLIEIVVCFFSFLQFWLNFCIARGETYIPYHGILRWWRSHQLYQEARSRRRPRVRASTGRRVAVLSASPYWWSWWDRCTELSSTVGYVFSISSHCVFY